MSIPTPAITNGRLFSQADVRLILAVTISGSVAAVIVDPTLWLTTAVVVFLLLRAGHKAHTPEIETTGDLEHLPARLRRVVRATRGTLPEGEAKEFFNALVSQAANVFAPRDSTFGAEWDRSTRRNVAELVEAACGVALDVARLDLAFARTMESNGRVAEGLLATRQLFVGRLRDSVAAVASLYAAGVEGGTPASDRVGDLVGEIRADADLTSHARKELDQLLRTGT
ncbi:MAG TPA: hypothetical protein VJ717_21280 [Gemmatimonadaceae bacterium]|nr:hypothetical protein [Gemmatimonadaceae bacterium]